MIVVPHPAEITHLVRETFLEFWADEDDLAGFTETVLVQRGRCCARSYRVDGYMAMWMVDVGILQFYDAEGNMLLTINVFEDLKPSRLAA